MPTDLDTLFDPHGAWIAPVPACAPPSTPEGWHGCAQAIEHGIGQLPADQQRVLLMRETLGCDVAEIANRLGLSAETVADLLLSARLELLQGLHGPQAPCPAAWV